MLLVAPWSGLSPVVLSPLISHRPTIPIVPAAVLILSPQSLQPLLLRVSVDVRPDDEADEVEERHPRLLRKERLRKSKREWRSDPRDLHHRHEACADRSADLVEVPGTSDNGH